MKRIFLLALSFLALQAEAQESNSYSLQQALDYAVKNSPLLKNADADVLIYKQKVKEITALGLPQINLEASFNHFLNIPTTVVPANAFNPLAPSDLLLPVQFGTKYQTSAGATLSQLIFDGSYIVGIKATNALMQLQLQLEQKAEIDIRNEVTKAYFSAVIAQENITTLGATLKNLEKLEAEIKAIYKEGLTESQDAEQIELTVHTMRTTIARAENMKKISFALLKLHMGMDVSTEISLTENVDQLYGSFNPADYQSREFAASQLPEYKLLQSQVTISEFSLKNEKMKYYPSFGAFITHSYNLPSNDLEFFGSRWYPTTIWGLKLNVPVFSSGMRRAKVEQARLSLEKSMNTLTNTENALKLQAQTAQLNFNFAVENLNTAKRSLELADRIQQKALIRYKEGGTKFNQGTSFELNQAQTQYLNAQSNYINALYLVLTSKAEMDKAFGLIQPGKNNSNDPKK